MKNKQAMTIKASPSNFKLDWTIFQIFSRPTANDANRPDGELCNADME